MKKVAELLVKAMYATMIIEFILVIFMIALIFVDGTLVIHVAKIVGVLWLLSAGLLIAAMILSRGD